MEHITDYLNRLFAKLPQTEELRQEKQRMLYAAQKEYADLRAQGLSEMDAVNRIIDSFASIDDLAHQYFSRSSASYDESVPVMEQRMADYYLQAGKTSAFLKAGGVGVIFLALAWANFTDIFDEIFGSFIGEMFENAAGFGTLLIIAAAICCFLQSSKKKHQFDFLNAGCYITPSGRSKIETFLSAGFQQQKALVIGIVLCIAAPFVSGTVESISLIGTDILADTMLFVILAAGIFVLVYRAAMNKFHNQCRAMLYRALRKNE